MPAPRTRVGSKCSAAIVDLADVRDGRRLREHQARLAAVVQTNRKALSRLFQSGVIFTRAGARLGRDLLLAHQHLVRVADLLARLAEISEQEARGIRDDEAEALFAQVHALLIRTSQLSAKSEGLLARGR